MEKMVVIIPLGEIDTVKDIKSLSEEIISRINDRGYSVSSICVDGNEVFCYEGFNMNLLGSEDLDEDRDD